MLEHYRGRHCWAHCQHCTLSLPCLMSALIYPGGEDNPEVIMSLLGPLIRAAHLKVLRVSAVWMLSRSHSICGGRSPDSLPNDSLMSGIMENTGLSNSGVWPLSSLADGVLSPHSDVIMTLADYWGPGNSRSISHNDN